MVEDEAIIAMEMETSLNKLGHEVTLIVNTGEKALQKVKEDEPDLVLMDIQLQSDMDGIDTAEIIQNKFGVSVIFCTSYLDEKRIERIGIKMPFGYILKPVQEEDLREKLEMIERYQEVS